MTRIGGKATQRSERRFETLNHCIQCCGQTGQLVGVAANRQPSMQGATIRNGFDLIDNFIDWFERAPRNHVRDAERQRQQERSDDQHHGDETAGSKFDVVRAQSHPHPIDATVSDLAHAQDNLLVGQREQPVRLWSHAERNVDDSCTVGRRRCGTRRIVAGQQPNIFGPIDNPLGGIGYQDVVGGEIEHAVEPKPGGVDGLGRIGLRTPRHQQRITPRKLFLRDNGPHLRPHFKLNGAVCPGEFLRDSCIHLLQRVVPARNQQRQHKHDQRWQQRQRETRSQSSTSRWHGFRRRAAISRESCSQLHAPSRSTSSRASHQSSCGGG